MNIDYCMLIELPLKFLQENKVYGSYARLLTKEIYDKYDCIRLKEDIRKKFNFFGIFKNLYCQSNQSLGVDIDDFWMITKNPQTWVMEFYCALLTISSKLTEDEATYFIETFFGHSSEEQISEHLGVCKSTLQSIKKSCIVKSWIELSVL